MEHEIEFKKKIAMEIILCVRKKYVELEKKFGINSDEAKISVKDLQMLTKATETISICKVLLNDIKADPTKKTRNARLYVI